MVAGREVMFALQVLSKLAELASLASQLLQFDTKLLDSSMVSAGNACKC